MKISKKIVSTGLALVLTVGMIPQVSYADNKSKVDVVENAAKEKIIKILSIPKTPDKLLEQITEYGIDLFFKHVINVQFGTTYGETVTKEQQILNLVKEMKAQIDKIEKTTDQTYLRVKQAALEAPLNSFMKDLSKVKSKCNDLADLYKKALSIEDEVKREEALEKFKNENLDRLRNLAGELNVLFDSTTQVIQGRGSDDIFKIYDQLISESYNFANGVPYEQRLQFRQSVVSTWLYGAMIVSVLDMGSTKGSFESQLSTLYANGKKLNNLVNKIRLMTPDQVEKFNKDGSRSVYCYTLGRFLALRDGNYYSGWSGALRKDLDDIPFYKHYYGVDCYDWDHVKSPFGELWKINTWSEERSVPFGSSYVTTDQYRIMLNKLPEGVSLFDELNNHGLNKKEDGSLFYSDKNLKDNGLMVGGETFVHNGSGNVHTWSMDVFNTTDKLGAAPQMNKTMLKVNTFYLRTGQKKARQCIKIESAVDPATFFVLTKM